MKRNIIIFLLSIILSACQFNLPSSEEFLNKNGVTKETYIKLNLCQQLDIVTRFGFNYIDEDHSVIIFPSWTKDNFTKPNLVDDLLICFKNNYDNLIEGTANANGNENEVRGQIKTTLYLLIELKLMKEPIAKEIYFDAICNRNITDDLSLLDFYYYINFSNFPDKISKTDDIVNTICSTKL